MIKDKLKENWGDKAEAMACNVYLRIFDPQGRSEWLIYAIDPEDDDTFMGIEYCAGGLDPRLISSLEALLSTHNIFGNYMVIDDAFRPRNAQECWKKIKERHPQAIITGE